MINPDANNPSDREIFDGLFDLMYEAEAISISEIHKNLREMKLDPDAMARHGIEFLRDCQRKVRLNAARHKRLGFADLLLKLLAEPIILARRGILEAELRPEDPQLQIVFNRRLKSITDTDLQSLAEDTLIRDLWAEFSAKPKQE